MNPSTIRTITRTAKAYRKFELFLGKSKEDSKTLQKLDQNGSLGKIKYGVLGLFGAGCAFMIFQPAKTKELIATYGPLVGGTGTTALAVLQVLSGKNDEFIRSEREGKGDLEDEEHAVKPIIRVEDADMAEEAMEIMALLTDYDPATIKQRVLGTDPTLIAEHEELIALRTKLGEPQTHAIPMPNGETLLAKDFEEPRRTTYTSPDGAKKEIEQDGNVTEWAAPISGRAQEVEARDVESVIEGMPSKEPDSEIFGIF